MNTDSNATDANEIASKRIAVKVFAVGSAGLNVSEQVAKCALPGAAFIAVNTDVHAVATSGFSERIFLESKPLHGFGTGGDPECGRAVALENLPRLKAACEGADAVFILAGLGGGAGTGISPVLAQAAKEAGALVLAFVTMPFDCEGRRRQAQARSGLEELKAAADGVICLPNQKILQLADESTSIIETFRIANELLAQGVSGVWRLMVTKGLIEIHFADLCALLRDRHCESAFAAADAQGPTRSRDAIDKLLAHPMLDGGKLLSECDAVLVSVVGGPDLAMSEVNRVMEQINGKCARAQVIMGAAVDELFRDRLAVTMVVTRRNESRAGNAAPNGAVYPDAVRPAPPLNDHLVNGARTGRPQSRFVPPPPALSPEEMEQLVSRRGNGAGRGRRISAKMRQGQLPLEIISKGRFDKSEPTIHRGEDLDVPTYIRRGISLN